MAERSVDVRWARGMSHDPRSVRLGNYLAALDYENGDALALKFGGDGDNGETLLFLLDVYFEDLDEGSQHQGGDDG